MGELESALRGGFEQASKDVFEKWMTDHRDYLVDPEELEDLRAQARSVKTLREENALLSRDNKTLEDRVDNLAFELSHRVRPAADSDELEEDNRRLKEDNKRLREERQREREGNERLTKDNESLGKECIRLEKESWSLGEDNKRLRKENPEEKDEIRRLEEDNQLLNERLKEANRLIQDLKKNAEPKQSRSDARLTPTLTEISSSSTALNSTSEGKTVALETYNQVVAKYNKVVSDNKNITAAKEQIQDLLRKRKDELHIWRDNSTRKDADIEKKKERIRRQDEEIRRLSVRLQEFEGNEMLTADRRQAKEGFKIGEDIKSNLRRPTLSAPSQLTDNFKGAENQLLPGELDARPVTSEGERHQEISTQQHLFRMNETIRSMYNPASGYLERIVPQSSPEPTLPMSRHRSVGSSCHEADVEITQFAPLEPESHHPSSDGDTEGSSPVNEHDNALPLETNEKNVAVQSSSSPEFVSCERVRKRPARNLRSDSPVLTKIKQEIILSSSPIGLAGFPNFDFNDSMDLDEIGEKMDTPKKRRRIELRRQVSRFSDTIIHPELDSFEHSVTNNVAAILPENISTPRRRGLGRTESVLKPLSPNLKTLPRTSDNKASRKRPREISDKTVKHIAEDGVTHQKLPQNGRVQPSPFKQAELNARLDGLLQHPSPEKQPLDPSRAPNPFDQQHGLGPSLSSDGSLGDKESDLPNGDEAKETRKLTDYEKIEQEGQSKRNRPIIDSSRSRYQDIIDRQDNERPLSSSRLMERQQARDVYRDGLPVKTVVTPRGKGISLPHGSDNTSRILPNSGRSPYTLKKKSSIKSRRASLSESGDLKVSSEDLKAVETTRKSQQPGSRPASRISTNPQPPFPDSMGADAPNDIPGNEPYRARPVHRLGLEHFKVNPVSNGGYEYAYTEVVRGKDNRRCLQGCTKPECCGNKFRALASEMVHTPQTSSQEAEQERLLNEYMGDQRDELRNMSAEQKKEVLLQAKARDLSNKYGKHRHTFARPKTPPGFWNADFPTTQEQVLTREAQRQHERAIVEERYQEAMRPGGRYMFRDE